MLITKIPDTSALVKQITSSKTKDLEAQKKLNSLITNDYHFFKLEFILQAMMDCKTHFFYQLALNTLELKNAKVLIIFLVGIKGSIYF